MLDQGEFLKVYNLERAFAKSGLKWDELIEIYEDYKINEYSKVKNLKNDLEIDFESENDKKSEERKEGEARPRSDIHIIYGRAKEPEHVVEKIIRKIGIEDSQKYKDINIKNYKEIITDLIGIRIIVVNKEGWREAHNLIKSLFPDFSNQKPIAYVCYGDREIFEGEDTIKTDYTVKGYRSQHYVVNYKGYYTEIQVRTMAEEVYGEFDHRVRYPYFQNNKFLIRYTNMISKSIAELDDMISTCMQLDKEMLDQLNERFQRDKYKDWAREPSESRILASKSKEEVFLGKSVEEIIGEKLL